MRHRSQPRYFLTPASAVLIVTLLWAPAINAQVRRGRGAVVHGEEASAAVGRRGAVVKGDEGYAAVGRRGAVAAGEEGAAAVGRRGAVVVGEEGAAARGRYGGVVVGNRYESYEAWRVVAGVSTAIAVGTMLARPPAAAVVVPMGGTSYYYNDGAYFTRVVTGGAVAYQAVGPPAGIIVPRLPAVGCSGVRVGGVSYHRCGATYYQPYRGGFRVTVIH
jgi:hypothetical protein